MSVMSCLTSVDKEQKPLISKQTNVSNGMSELVKKRLDKWDKVGSNRQKRYLERFCEWLGKSKEEIVASYYRIEKAQMLETWKRDMGDYIYTWYKHLLTKKGGGYKHNSARVMAFDVAVFCKRTCSQVIFDRKIPKAVESTRIEHQFTVEELKRMFVAGDVEERCILQLGVNLMLRINDFACLRREPFEKAVKEVKAGAECPFQVKVETGKEKIVAYAQLTYNTIETFDAYLKTKETSKYLFSENYRRRHITARQLNYCLKRLWEKAHPERKSEVDSIHWHLLRKYGMTMLFNAKVDMTAIKLIVGKTVDVDVRTYLQTVKLADMFNLVLPYVELGSYVAVQPRTLEEQRQRELILIEQLKVLTDKIEELTGERPQVSVPIKREIPNPEELKELLNNGDNNHKSRAEKSY